MFKCFLRAVFFSQTLSNPHKPSGIWFCPLQSSPTPPDFSHSSYHPLSTLITPLPIHFHHPNSHSPWPPHPPFPIKSFPIPPHQTDFFSSFFGPLPYIFSFSFFFSCQTTGRFCSVRSNLRNIGIPVTCFHPAVSAISTFFLNHTFFVPQRYAEELLYSSNMS